MKCTGWDVLNEVERDNKFRQKYLARDYLNVYDYIWYDDSAVRTP
jgi:hypothetical protein